MDAEVENPKNINIKKRMCFEAKRIIEALLFASNEPLHIKKIRDIVSDTYPMDSAFVRELIEDLRQEYRTHHHAYQIQEVAQGYLLHTKQEYSPYLNLLFHGKKPDRLSHAASEVLAIIAYRQPITRHQIEEIRGVDSSALVSTLMERHLIESVGKLEVAGRPTLFGVSKQFLKHYGLRDIKDLPDFDGVSKEKKTAELPADVESDKE